MFDEIVNFFQLIGDLINAIIENCCLVILPIGLSGIVILIFYLKRRKQKDER